RLGLASGQVSAQRLTLAMHILQLGAVFGGLVELQPPDLLVGQRQLESVAEGQQVGVFEFFVRVRGHAALAGGAHAIAFFGVGQDDGGLAAVCGRRCVRRVYLYQIVSAALQGVYLFVGHALDQALRVGTLAAEVLWTAAVFLGGIGPPS